MKFGYYLPADARVLPEVVDYIFGNASHYVGFTVKPGVLAKFTARQVGCEECDVLRTWQQMVADEQLVVSGYFYPDDLYSVNAEMR